MMQEPTIPLNEAERLASLQSLDILDSPPEARFDRIVRLAARIFQVPIALLTLVDCDRMWIKAGTGLDVSEIPRNISFCGHAINETTLFLVEDTLQDSRFAENPLVTGEPYIRFYAGYPLSSPAGHRVGALCLIDRVPRTLSQEERENLEDLAMLAQNELGATAHKDLLEQRKRQEQDLLESQLFMASVTRAIPAIIYVYDLIEQRVVYLNTSVEGALGYNHAHLMAINPDIGKKLIHPDDLSRIHTSFDRLKKSPPGTVIETEIRYLHSRGDYRWFQNREQVFKWAEGEAVSHILGISQDITERKMMEEAIKDEHVFALQVMNTIGQGLTVVNKQGKFEFVNPAYADMIGYSPEELIGRSPFEFTFPEDHPRIEEAWAEREALKKSSFETRLKRVDGSEVFVLVSGAPRLRNSQFIGSVAVVTDLTERRRLEKALREARDQALEASRTKSEFLATVSHEIRTPLNGIIGMSDLLVETPLDKDQEEFATIIRDSGYSLLSILNDILDFSKIEAGKLILDNGPFEISKVVDSVAELMASQAAAKGISLLTYVVPTIPGKVLGDAGRLRQVLLNLVGNAIKFTDEGEILIQAVLLEETNNQCRIKFHVRDKGVGIPAEAIESIFEPFTQVDNSTTRIYGGSGLGLAISKRLVGLMDGKIGVESEPGKGSNFWFTLPYEVLESRLRFEPPAILAGRKLAIVSASLNNREIIGRYSGVLGLQAYRLTNAKSALELMKNEPDLDFCLVDTRLPETERGILEEAFSGYPRLHPVLLSDYEARNESRQPGQFNYATVINRPFRFSFFEDTLLELLDHKQRNGSRPARKRHNRQVSFTQELRAGRLILVVEDNPANQKLSLSQLEKLGYVAHTVANGQEALEALKRLNYGLVLLDLMLPVMDGLETARQIRAEEEKTGKHLPVIAMTANIVPEFQQKCRAVGMDDIITKPVSLQQLAEVIKQWLPERTD